MEIFEIELNASNNRFVRDHKFLGTSILPAAAYVEFVIANFEHWNQSNSLVIRRMRINSPMVFKSDATKKIQIKYERKDEVYKFSIVSKGEDSIWIVHVEGEIYAKSSNDITKLKSDQCIIDGSVNLNKDQIYNLYDSTQLKYDEFYRSVQSALINKTDAYAELRLNYISSKENDNFYVNPAILDGAFQSAGIPAFYAKDEEKEVLLPYYIEEIIYNRAPSKLCFCISKQRKNNFEDSPIKKYDISICDNDRNICLQINCFTIKRVVSKEKNTEKSSETNKREIAQINIPANSFYIPEWVKVNESKNCTCIDGDKFIIIANNNNKDMENLISSEILSRNGIPLILRLGNEFNQDTEKSFTVRATCFEDYKYAIRHFFQEFGHIDRIVHISTLGNKKINTDTINMMEERLSIGLISIFNIVRAFRDIEHGSTNSILSIVTSYASKVLEDDEVCCEYVAMLGIIKTVNMEYPTLKCNLIDIDKYENSKKILDTLLKSNLGVHCALRNNILYEPQMLTTDLPKLDKGIDSIRKNGVYLITGGCGFIGITLAEYLSKYTAVKIILLNRTEYPKKAEWQNVINTSNDKKLVSKIRRLMDIEKNGAELFLYSVDVSNYYEMKNIVTKIEKEVGQINGVIHAAGILRDRLIVNMKQEDFYSTLKPKVYGLWNLDNLLKENNMDFFVLISSVTSTIGNKGQCNYAAANAFLDAFPLNKHKNIKNVVSINWGTWLQGMASKSVIEANEKIGLISISNEMGVAAFKRILDSGCKNVVFVPADKNKFDFNKIYSFVMKIEEVDSIDKTEHVVEQKSLNLCSKEKIQKIIIKILSQKLKLDYSEFDINTVFTDYGIDSINIGDIVDELNCKLRLQLDPTVFFEYKNIEEVSTYIMEKIDNTVEYKKNEEIVVSNYVQDNKSKDLKKYIRNSETYDDIKDVAKEKNNNPQKLKNDKNYKSEIINKIKNILSEVLSIDKSEINDFESFSSYGVDSIVVNKIVGKIFDEINIEIDPTEFFENSNLDELCEKISGRIVVKGTEESQANIISKLQEYIIKLLSQILEIEIKEFNVDTNFLDYGIDQIIAAKFVENIKKNLNIDLDINMILEFENIRELSKYLIYEFKNEITLDMFTEKEAKSDDLSNSSLINNEDKIFNYEKVSRKKQSNDEEKNAIYTVSKEDKSNDDIAIIGFSCRLPEASNAEEFWNNLVSGNSSIKEIPYDRIDWKGYACNVEEEDSKKLTCRSGGFIKDVDKFDAAFFGISPNEAKLMDPQQRIMLELAFEAFESAGYINNIENTDTGVFVGASYNYYEDIINKSKEYDSPYRMLGNMQAVIANRISYFFGLNGVSENITTLCSSALVAVTSACDNIKSGKCSLAIAGGVRLLIPPEHYVGFAKLNIISSDGKCKAFDKNASGFISGEGGGFILLKSLKKAVEDGDKIYGVIKGYGTNSNGKSNGIMAPNPKAQEKLLVKTYESSGVNPKDLWYLEANGTGTLYGDSLEIKALTNVFKRYTNRKAFCAIGSVKTNIGHLEPASGIADILKVLMCFKYGMIPPTLNFTQPNEMAKFEDSPFYVNDKVVKNHTDENPRIAAISSFGMGGTNAHIILQQFLENELISKKRKCNYRKYNVVPISAKTRVSLLNSIKNLKEYIFKDDFYNMEDNNLDNISYTLGKGRKHFNKRVALICRDIEQLRDKLEIVTDQGIDKFMEKNKIYNSVLYEEVNKVKCVFLFTDCENTNYNVILRNVLFLLNEEKEFKGYFEEFLRQADLNDLSIIEELVYKEKYSELNSVAPKLKKILLTAYQYSIALLLISWGIKPDICMGEKEGSILANIIQNNNDYSAKYVFSKVFSLPYEEVSENKIKLIGKNDVIIEFGVIKENVINNKNKNHLMTIAKWKNDSSAIHEIVAKLYCLGYDINWKSYFKDKGFIIQLPSYAFDKQSYWVTINKSNNKKIEENQFENKYKNHNEVESIANQEKESEAIIPIKKDNIEDIDLKEKIVGIFINEIIKNLGYEKEQIDLNKTLDDIGFDSIMLGKVIDAYEKILDFQLDPTEMFEYNTVNKYTDYLVKEYREQFLDKLNGNSNIFEKHIEVKENYNDTKLNEDIKYDEAETYNKINSHYVDKKESYDMAIIGISGKFPGADNPQDFFENLCKGKSLVTEIPKERWDIEEFYSKDANELGKTNCRYGSFVNDIDKFDPRFFGISINKAAMIDPQQRLMLEVAWKAVEDAGYSNSKISGTKTGVYIGICNSEYMYLKDKDYKKLSPHLASGNTFSIIANRISYELNVNGPSMAIDAACSSSIVALHNACKDILLGDCEMGLVGGVNLTLSPSNQIIFSKANLLSEDGIVRPFDENSNGYVRSEGVGAILIKPLSKAVEDRDNIYAVIKGIAVMHSGQSNGLNTPNPIAQKKAIMEAYRKSSIDMKTISYIEAHATGTKLGDQIEFRAMSNAFKEVTDKKQFCAITTTKGNIGHAESASGIIAIIKVAMALKAKKIPPLLNFNTKNKRIKMVDSPFYINDKLSYWKAVDGVRRAGINCFGFGGVNSHVILEEYKGEEENAVNENNKGYIITMSSENLSTLAVMCNKFEKFINSIKDFNLYKNICYTLACGRSHYKYRIAVSGDTFDETREKFIQMIRDGGNCDVKSHRINNRKQVKDIYIFLVDKSLNERKDILKFYNCFSDYRYYFNDMIDKLPLKYKNAIKFVFEDSSLETLNSINVDLIISIIHICSVYKFLFKLGIKFQGICALGDGIFSMLIISKIIKIEELDKLLEGKIPTIDFQKSQIDCDLFTVYNQEVIELKKVKEKQISINDFIKNSSGSMFKELPNKGGRFKVVDTNDISSVKLFRNCVLKFYTSGIDINWFSYYKNDKNKIVSVPGYIFNKKSYWYI